MEHDTEEMILHARVNENGNLKDDDLEELQNHGEKWWDWATRILKPCTNFLKTFGMTMFVAKKLKKNLTAFFNSIKTKYATSTLWVIYSCINSYMIDQYGSNLRSLVRLTRHMKMKTSYYVSKKSGTFSAEQIHEVIAHCMNNKVYDRKKRSLAFA